MFKQQLIITNNSINLNISKSFFIVFQIDGYFSKSLSEFHFTIHQQFLCKSLIMIIKIEASPRTFIIDLS